MRIADDDSPIYRWLLRQPWWHTTLQ